MVAQGKVDIECGATTATLSRQERVDFSLMTFVDGAANLCGRFFLSAASTERQTASRIGATSNRLSHMAAYHGDCRRLSQKLEVPST